MIHSDVLLISRRLTALKRVNDKVMCDYSCFSSIGDSVNDSTEARGRRELIKSTDVEELLSRRGELSYGVCTVRRTSD